VCDCVFVVALFHCTCVAGLNSVLVAATVVLLSSLLLITATKIHERRS